MNKQQLNDEILRYLVENQEEAYRIFTSKLIPNCKRMYGVRIPLQRKIAKKIAAEDWKLYLEFARDDSFEEVNIQGFVLGYAKGSFSDKEPFLRSFIAKISDWSVCDGFCASLKQVKTEPGVWWNFLWGYLDSGKEYELRFVLVMWLWYFLEETYIEQIIKKIVDLKWIGYYDKMAAAWCLAEIYSKNPEDVKRVLIKGELDFFVHQKCIQKICDSLKIKPEEKKELKKLRLDKKFTKFL